MARPAELLGRARLAKPLDMPGTESGRELEELGNGLELGNGEPRAQQAVPVLVQRAPDLLGHGVVARRDLDPDAAPVELVPDAAREPRPLQPVDDGGDRPVVRPWGRFVVFADPDGNGWAVQEIMQTGDDA